MKYQFEECIGSRVRSLSRRIDNIYRKHLGDSGITENQLSIMMALHKTGIVEQKRIGEVLSLEKSSLSRNLVRLIDADYIVKSGLINRPMIKLTNKGLGKVDELVVKWERAMDEVHQVLGEKDVMAFNQFEKRIWLL